MPLYKRNNIWWYRFKFRGTLIAQSSKSGNKDVARRLETEHRRKLELGQQGLNAVMKPKTFKQAADDFIEFKTPHWDNGTLTMHNGSLVHLEPVFGKKMLTEITPTLISKYQTLRQAEKAANRTINIELSLVRMTLKHNKLWANIVDDVEMLRERKNVGRELTDDEQERLWNTVKSSASKSLYPAVLVSTHTGLRNKELRMLKWKQIDLEDGWIVVGESKGGTDGEGRLVALSNTAVEVLKAWKSQFDNVEPEHFVFPSCKYALMGKKGTFGGEVRMYKIDLNKPQGSFAKAWGTAKRNAKVSCRWHDLRHTAASHVGAGGATDRTMQDLFGWMDASMIKRYSHVRKEALKQAVKVFDEPETAEPPQTLTLTIEQARLLFGDEGVEKILKGAVK